MSESTNSESTLSVSTTVAAPADEVFAFVSSPGNHPEISGDGSVKGTRIGPEQLTGLGDKFGMRMKMFGVPYRITNTVVEFEPGRTVAWAHPGKHVWRWEVEPVDASTCTVTETFDMSPSPLKIGLRALGYPEGHRDNMEGSVRNVAAHFA